MARQEKRNAGHRARRAALYAAAQDDGARLVAAFDWFRSSAVLLARRRPPLGAHEKANELTSADQIRAMTAYLKQAAEAIDRGEHDAGR